MVVDYTPSPGDSGIAFLQHRWSFTQVVGLLVRRNSLNQSVCAVFSPSAGLFVLEYDSYEPMRGLVTSGFFSCSSLGGCQIDPSAPPNLPTANNGQPHCSNYDSYDPFWTTTVITQLASTLITTCSRAVFPKATGLPSYHSSLPFGCKADCLTDPSFFPADGYEYTITRASVLLIFPKPDCSGLSRTIPFYSDGTCLVVHKIEYQRPFTNTYRLWQCTCQKSGFLCQIPREGPDSPTFVS